MPAWLAAPVWACGEEAIRLQEAFPPGYQYHVSSRVELTGTMTLPEEKGQATAKTLAVTGTSAIEYDERILDTAADGQVQKTLRIFRRIDLQRRVGDRPQESTIRPVVRRMVVLRLHQAEVPFSPDGPLTWGEIDLVRTDVFTPALAGLLPAKPVRPGERWTAEKSAIQELTDMEHIDDGHVECRFEQITTLSRRRHARIAFSGTVRGINEDGPNRQELDGYLFFDLESNHVSYLSLKGISWLLDKDGKALGRIEGQFVLTRQAHTHAADLRNEALTGAVLEANAENTRLLYENHELGVRFLYPRRWHVAGVHGRQIALDEANGSGLLLTLESAAQVPSGEQFLAESKNFLQQQKAKVLRADPPRRIQVAPQELAHFGLEAEVNGQRVWMDYYVIRQGAGGGTLAARLLPSDLPALQKEVEQIARSVVVEKQR
ncbi:MAG TPA: hypothetical protein VKU02_24570 [Gemmataceae bacterium]|nr:hypothetical protein [Gemmataceae bacterium]